MDRPRIYVNRILTAEKIGTFGLVDQAKEISHCIKWAFQLDDAEKLKVVAKVSSNGTNVCSHFWHFLVYAYLDNNLTTGNIFYFDCKNDMELAFEACDIIHPYSNGKSYKQNFFEQFLIMEENYEEIKGIAELAIAGSF